MTASEIDYPSEENGSETEDSVSVEILENFSQCSKRRQRSEFLNPRPRKAVRTNSTTESQEGGLVLRRIQSKILRMEPLISVEKVFCLDMAKDFVSDYPHFKVVMQPSFLCPGGQMNVQTDFAREYMDKKTASVILLNSDQRKWHVSYCGGSSTFHKKARFKGGWLKFARKNNLEIGDVCAFELINHTDIIFRVSIFKFHENAKSGLSSGEPGSCKSKSNLNQASAGQQRPQGITREFADKFTSEYPFFRITFRPSHQHSLTAPWNKFTEKLAKQTVEKEMTLMHLQVGEKSWQVKFNIYPEHKQGKFGYGWLAFARENCREIGDDCVFELINKNDAIVKVSIFKKNAP